MKPRGLTLVEVGVVCVVFAALLAAAYPFLKERKAQQEGIDAGVAVYSLCQKAGTWRQVAEPAPIPSPVHIMRFDSGRLADGFAIYFPVPDAAFWVTNDDTVYIVNDNAKNLLPNQPVAPPAITYEKVLDVAD